LTHAPRQTFDVSLPARLDALAALAVGEQLCERAAANGSIRIQVPGTLFAEPFAMLYLVNVARSLKRQGLSFSVSGNGVPRSYAAYMGFFDEFGLPYERRSDGTYENDRYIAIRDVTRSSLVSLANEQGASHVGETIEREAATFAKLLAQGDDNNLVFALTYCLREIMRNAYEHSGAESLQVCAQYRPSSGRVDLALSDGGCGLLATLRRRRHISVASDEDAIKVALMPGITGSITLRGMEDDPWRNSGYGLFMTQRICREGGAFEMASNNAFIRLSGKYKIEKAAIATGTVVGMTIHLDVLKAITKDTLARFHKEGAALAKTLRGANVTASVASLKLRMSE
jgi:anti-sigma regulatory factor (Ser/Thr protein kinase)